MSPVRKTRAAERAPVLLLDIGNTRLKWALVREPYRRGQRFLGRGALELERLAPALAALLRRVGPLAGIEVCNVAGASMARRVGAQARRNGLSRPHFARTVSRAGGVRNGYPQPWRLGVDRWMALIGAHAEYPARALCLVAVGTALTIDLLDARGRHRGGSILPGPRLMIDALLERTAGIRRRAGGRRSAQAAAGERPAPFARDTRGAVAAGALYACVALIEESLRRARLLLGRTPRLIVSGGAARSLTPLLRTHYRVDNDLALRGLALLRSTRRRLA